MYEKCKSLYGISDVYAYSVPGLFIKVVGEIITSLSSPFRNRDKPKTLMAYYLKDGRTIILVNLGLHGDDVECREVEEVEIENDIFRPASRAVFKFVDCNLDERQLEFLNRVKSRFSVDLKLALYRELGYESLKAVYIGHVADKGLFLRIVTALLTLADSELCEDEVLERAVKAYGECKARLGC